MKRVGFLITARLKSTRLPMKLLAHIGDAEVVRHVVRRAKQVFGIDRVILCTSTNQQDLPLIDIAHQEGVFYFAGSENDVLERLGSAARLFCLDSFVSMTADNPLFCTYHASRVADLLRREDNIDYIYINGLPIGTAVYGLSTAATGAISELKINSDTEIWGPFVNRPEFFGVHTMQATAGFEGSIRLTIDYPEDYNLMLRIAAHLSKPFSSITLPDIYRAFQEKSELTKINTHIVQKGIAEDILLSIDNYFANHSQDVRDIINKHKGVIS